jgi:hypothetical protein
VELREGINKVGIEIAFSLSVRRPAVFIFVVVILAAAMVGVDSVGRGVALVAVPPWNTTDVFGFSHHFQPVNAPTLVPTADLVSIPVPAFRFCRVVVLEDTSR